MDSKKMETLIKRRIKVSGIVSILSVCLGMGYARVAAEEPNSIATPVEQDKELVEVDEKGNVIEGIEQEPEPIRIYTSEEKEKALERRNRINYHNSGPLKPDTFEDYMELKKRCLESTVIIQSGEFRRQIYSPPAGKDYPILPKAMFTTKDGSMYTPKEGVNYIPLISFTEPFRWIVDEAGNIFLPSQVYKCDEKLGSQLASFYWPTNDFELDKSVSLDELLIKVDKQLAEQDTSHILSGKAKFVFGKIVMTSMGGTIARIENGKEGGYGQAVDAPVIPGINNYVGITPGGKRYPFSITLLETKPNCEAK